MANKQIPDNVDKASGEVYDKRYEMPEHALIGNSIMRQVQYVHEVLRDEKDRDKFARLSADTLSMVLMELTAMYESLAKWLADEKLHVADTKTAIDMKFADTYLMFKRRKSETNETARMQAKLACQDDEHAYNKIKNDYDRVDAWKKVIGRYHDAVRSQLSYEKQMGGMSRGQ